MTLQHGNKTVIIGDFNARINNLNVFDNPSKSISYSHNIDNGTNSSGKQLTNLCQNCNLMPVNHLKHMDKTFEGSFTYKQGSTWKSQIDWALITIGSLKHIIDFQILCNIDLPTDHAPLTLKLGNFSPSLLTLAERAQQLGQSYVRSSSCRKALRISSVDCNGFANNLPDAETFWAMANNTDVSRLTQAISDKLYNTASDNMVPKVTNTTQGVSQNAHNRWCKILQSNDSRQLWTSINWNGSFDTPVDQIDQPSENEFCKHYQKLLIADTGNLTHFVPDPPKYMPCLDDDITPFETEQAVKTLKSSKAAGLDGLPPGLLKYLTTDWTILLTYVFNLVFSGVYPDSWKVAKMFNIYKKGNRMDPANYRGISIIQALAKLYDIILSKRFISWYKPRQQQAGAQKGRGCEEQILAVRLLIDIARKCNRTLFITFIDFSKAYDMVDRTKLLKHLDHLGCGTKFLLALKSCLMGSSCQIGSETFATTAGVRQGASSSCPLFTCFIDPIVDAIATAGDDDWLKDMHSILLMDDTAVLATSREQMAKKLRLLVDKTHDLGMMINPSKSKFICVNGDNSPFNIGEIVIEHTDAYMYLGVPVSASAITKQVQDHMSAKNPHVLKFASFLVKNSDAPWQVKFKVWDSAVKSALFFSCQTWLTNNLRSAESVYNTTLKLLLGVRTTVCNDLVHIELGLGSAKSFVRQRQKEFLSKLTSRNWYNGSYLARIIDMAVVKRSPAGIIVQQILSVRNGHNYVTSYIEETKTRIRSDTSSRRITYLEINPQLSVHGMYRQHTVTKEKHRIDTSRLRLGSHRLKIETGRWSRIPRELRLCPCGEVQTESHVLCQCPLTQHIRDNFSQWNLTSIPDIMINSDIKGLCEFCSMTVNFFSS